MAHWYLPSGKTFHKIESANGSGLRDTTLRDARKVNAVPSSTTIIAQLDKSGLTHWKLGILMQEVFSNLQKIYISNYNVDTNSFDAKNFVASLANHRQLESKIWATYKQETEKYSKQGNEIHEAFEEYYKYGKFGIGTEAIIKPAVETIKELTKNFKVLSIKPEVTFYNKLGYGGTIDLVIETDKGYIIIDFKTKQGEDVLKSIYDDYAMQLASYAINVDNVLMCANLFVSVTHPGKHALYVWSEDKIEKSLQKFKYLLEYWKLANNYDPTLVKDEQS